MDLPSIERACEVVLVGGVGTPQERSEAQQRVLALGADVSNISIIQSILDGSENNYAIVVAAQSLLRLVTGACVRLRCKTVPESPARMRRVLLPNPTAIERALV